MTTEIAIMNRRALVLAADSAGTVTSWVNGRQEVRFFKGENKVFQLVTDRPVGLMTFGNAHVMHVPWDVVVKEYRRSVDSVSFMTVDEYAAKFFAHLEADRAVFPLDAREDDFKAKVGQQIMRVAVEAFQTRGLASVESSTEKLAAFGEEIKKRRSEVESRDPHPPFTEGDIDKAVADLKDDALGACAGVLNDTVLAPLIGGLETDIFLTAINLIYRSPGDAASSTGIVIAGFAEGSVFPALIEFRVYGFIRERLLYEKISETAIDAKHTGDIQSYASTSMVETFTHGLNAETFGRVTQAYRTSVAELLSDVETEIGQSFSEKEVRIDTSYDAFANRCISDIVGVHNGPLVNVVSMLAIDEMANLAETLISLESLKEKVTRPTETVGGPVDIAAITKAEGLVWIKRKHYFDMALNPRYAAKLAQSGGQK